MPFSYQLRSVPHTCSTCSKSFKRELTIALAKNARFVEAQWQFYPAYCSPACVAAGQLNLFNREATHGETPPQD